VQPGTITQVNPPRVRLDGATSSVTASTIPGQISGGIKLGTRVLTELIDGRLYIFGGESDWQPLPLTGGASQYSDLQFGPVGFRRDAAGVVHLRGLVTVPGPGGIAGLPQGYRPGFNTIFACTGDGVFNEVRVHTNGVIDAYVARSWLSLWPISYLAEQ
jgi:hypothetical protein